jgi:branched-chain amino acid transport system substrate-binding protein
MKKYRIIAIILRMTLLAALVPDAARAIPRQRQRYHQAGFLGAKTVNNANYGIPGEKGMKMAIEELNAKGGILGRKLKEFMKTIRVIPGR